VWWPGGCGWPRWRGRRAAIFAILGFLCLLFTFLGVNLLLGGLHTFKSFTG